MKFIKEVLLHVLLLSQKNLLTILVEFSMINQVENN
jgi:hypothetical protein